MKSNVRIKLGGAFGLVSAIFLLVGAVAYRNVTEQTEATAWVVHTHAVQSQLGQTLAAIQDAEAAQRSYLLTGDESYLTSYAAAITLTEATRKALKGLIADNPRQVAREAALAPLIAEKTANLQEGIDARRSRDLAAAQAVVSGGRGKRTMDAIHNLVQEMDAEEEQLLRPRSQVAANEVRITKLTLVLGTLLGLAIAAIAAVLLARDIARPLGELSRIAERITVGDLSVVVATNARSDEVGVLTRAFERMTRSLRAMATAADQIAAGDLRVSVQPQSTADQLGNAFARMVANLRRQIGSLVEGAAVLGSAASEIVASTSQLASGASESAAAVTQTTTTVEEIRQTARLSSQKAKAVSDSAQRAAEISQDGRKSTEDVVSGMDKIRGQM